MEVYKITLYIKQDMITNYMHQKEYMYFVLKLNCNWKKKIDEFIYNLYIHYIFIYIYIN